MKHAQRNCGSMLFAGTMTLVAVMCPSTASAADGGPIFAWPLSPRPYVVTAFDLPDQDWLPGHRGIDVAGTDHQSVLAAGDGVVVFAGPVGGRSVLSIDHAGGLRTTYEPVTAAVTVGTRVSRGDVIGTLDAGHPGCATACLHWGLKRGVQYLDPTGALHTSPIRLLPHNG